MLRKYFNLFIFIIILISTSYLFLNIGKIFDPFSINLNARYQKPSLNHPFGTDYLGRDLFARTMYAIGISLKISIIALFISFILSFIFGSISGFFHNKFPDKIISWIYDILITVPLILILSAALSVLKPSIEITYLIVGLLIWPIPARLIKGEIIQIKNSTFILADKALGIPKYLTILKSFPLIFYPALSNLLFNLPELITLEIGISFLGFGVQPPNPSLGKLIFQGILDANIAWWEALFPVLVLIILMILIFIFTQKLKFKY